MLKQLGDLRLEDLRRTAEQQRSARGAGPHQSLFDIHSALRAARRRTGVVLVRTGSRLMDRVPDAPAPSEPA